MIYSYIHGQDPIHGNISIGPLCLRIIDTSEFQRLDKLKQLGVSNFVFRGATHTRFSHSVSLFPPFLCLHHHIIIIIIIIIF